LCEVILLSNYNERSTCQAWHLLQKKIKYKTSDENLNPTERNFSSLEGISKASRIWPAETLSFSFPIPLMLPRATVAMAPPTHPWLWGLTMVARDLSFICQVYHKEARTGRHKAAKSGCCFSFRWPTSLMSLSSICSSKEFAPGVSPQAP
jgi:hypothetical protein